MTYTNIPTIRAAAMAAMMATTAAAEDLKPDAITITGFSYHGDRLGYTTPDGKQKPWNEVNPGIALSWDIDAVHTVTAAAFLNSYDGVGAAITVDQIWFRADDWSAGIFSGLGYYPTYGAYQITSYGNLGSEYEDYFLVGGFLMRFHDFQIRYTPSDGDSSDFASISYVIDLGERPSGSIGQAVGWNF